MNIVQLKQSHHPETRKKRSFPIKRRHYKRETDVEDQLNSEEEMEGDENDELGEGEENEEEENEEYVEPNHDRLDEENEETNEKPIKLTFPFWDTYDSINQLYLELSKYF